MTKKHKKNKNKGKKLTAGQLRKEITNLFKRIPKKRLNANQVGKKLRVANNSDSINDALAKLQNEGILYSPDDVKYRLDRKHRNSTASPKPERKTYTGRVDMTRSGSAYIIVDELKEDVYVARKRVNGALHGDKVRILAIRPHGRRRMEGRVMEVVERARESFLGTLHQWQKYGVVVVDHSKAAIDVIVQQSDQKDAREGDKVIVKVTHWPDRHNHNPLGVVTAVLGPAGSNDVEMQSILLNNGFDLGFSEEVLREAEALTDDLGPKELLHRRDLRDAPTFTIDPEDAKDFDDALSFRYTENGLREIGVHIADVAHYVKPGTALDKKAYRQSTSVYLVDRVLPMLPEKISNELCSLRPNEDKRTFSAVFLFDKKDRLVARWFGKTLIHSDRRFAYEEAQKVLDTGNGDFASELKELNRLAHKLRKDRFKNGSISFESDEVRIRLDRDGKPIEITTKERMDAHMLIEDYMLLANKEVATFIYNKSKEEGREVPFVYRVHDTPDPDRLLEFSLFAQMLGFKMDLQTPRKVADSFNRLAEAARHEPALQVLQPIGIRTMAKAEYSTDNIGHYGLGFEFYAHFTSPIRRYSDVLAHRILEENLKGTFRMDKEKLEEQCKRISQQERNATDAERESIKYKQVEFMQNHLGEVFDGFVSGIIDSGLFIELAGNKCEGFVPFSTMDDLFEVENGRLIARGEYSGKVFKMGDALKVRIVAADIDERTIDMEMAE